MQNALQIILVVGGLVFHLGCGGISDDSKPEIDRQGPVAQVDSDKVVARVDGIPILSKQVRELIDAVDGGLPVDEALEILIRNELLAAEARRRGFDAMNEVNHTQDIALVRAILKKQISEGINPDSLNQEKLKQYYELQKERFVHGMLRRVVHIVALVGKKEFTKEEAAQLGSRIAISMRNVKSEDEFIALGETFRNEYSNKVNIESLPPFAVETKMIVEPFVTATFALDKVGQVSPPIQTKFGWHVIYLAEELPPKNRSFEEVKKELSEEVLPSERKMKTKEWFDRLDKDNNIFVYENVLNDEVQSQ
ncbi:MAG: hypothetical protein GY847_37540 [Proteobacteria bacterium]|nr:hypothetical protein [Pseudomonadota bacterium]